MARLLRLQFPGAAYHVTSRGKRREPIYEDDTDRNVFLEICGAALERFDACSLAYCLMGNHYHLVIHTRQGNLSRLMRQINGVCTQSYNRRHRKLGRPATTTHDTASASSRYAALAEQGKDIRLWDIALRQQIYLGDGNFVERLQALLLAHQTQTNEIPVIQRRKTAMPISDYLRAYHRDQAIVLAYREGQHTMTAIAKEVGLSVARISRVISGGAKGKT